MDFTTLTSYFVPVVVLACLVLGYIIKTSIKFIPNDFIPTILAVIGAISNVIVSGLSFETVVYGALMGLASTGLYEAFRNWIENIKK